MRPAVRRSLFIFAAILLSVVSAIGQAPADAKPLMSEEAFKNVQVLKGIPVNEFMATMGFISASLGETCTDCHVGESGGSWDRYADDTPRKRTARRMMAMVTAIDKSYFAGQRVVTCYSCHRGGERPRITPSLADLYGPPHPEEPDQIFKEGPGKPAPDQVLDRYLEALGGAKRLAAVTSFTAKGTYKGFSDIDTNPLEIYAKAPNQRAMVIHAPNGDSTSVYDGRAAWNAAPATDSPVPVVELAGGDLDGARLDAELSFPSQIKQTLKQWRVGYPATIDDKDMQVVQGTSDGRYPVNLYFDSKTGLLVRLVRYTDSPIGLSPTQIDYSDYRDVSGVKMPHKWTITWLDGRAIVELNQIQANAAINTARFAKPAPPVTRNSSKK
jgi:photosynthetic reaction center cytochrome c subunit